MCWISVFMCWMYTWDLFYTEVMNKELKWERSSVMWQHIVSPFSKLNFSAARWLEIKFWQTLYKLWTNSREALRAVLCTPTAYLKSGEVLNFPDVRAATVFTKNVSPQRGNALFLRIPQLIIIANAHETPLLESSNENIWLLPRPPNVLCVFKIA